MTPVNSAIGVTTMQKEQERERRINIILDPTTHKRLRIEAVELDQPMNRIAANVLQNHFKERDSRESMGEEGTGDGGAGAQLLLGE